MKKYFLIALVASAFSMGKVSSQMVYVPDPIFRQALISHGYGLCIVGDSIDASCPAVANASTLSISSLGITSLQGIQAFGNLSQLWCANNNLTSLPALPQGLLYLSCDDNSLVSLPSLPNLTHLLVSRNNLSSLPALPTTLLNLDCGQNALSALPALPDSLNTLNCGDNALTSLPPLPARLNTFSCSDNQINFLPALPNGLSMFNCDNNNLYSLPPLPDSLVIFSCGSNHLDSLPSLPGRIYELVVRDNSLRELPLLPNSLYSLSCNMNSLTTLPPIPGNCRYLNCAANHLESIPPLPQLMNTFYCSDNPNLACLPPLTTIQILNFGNTMVYCVPNYGNVGSSYPDVHSLPICTILNGCNTFSDITGRAYLDVDSNCVDSTESGIGHMKILLMHNGNLEQIAFTRSNGLYSFDVDSFGTYEIDFDSANSYSMICPANGAYLDSITPTDSVLNDLDFALKCSSHSFNFSVWSMVTRLVTGRSQLLTIGAGDVTNLIGHSCASGVSATLTVTLGPHLSYSGPAAGALTPTSVSGNVVSFFVSDVGQLSPGDFSFWITTDSVAVVGDTICITALISTGIPDLNPEDNAVVMCFVVRASLDPNEKQVSPTGIIDTTIHWLTYTLQFQNTGTAEAFNIYLIDTLDPSFDLSSIQVLSSSHECYSQVVGNLAKFSFSNINLPDSISDEPHSHGYVQYKIQLKDNLPTGTQIRNTGYIYFDFNPAVVTNTTLNEIGVESGIANIDSALLNTWPVPFDERFSLSTKPGSNYFIYDLLGKEIKNGKTNSSQTVINTSNWKPGVYFLKVERNGQNVSRKLIKY